jgi:hypothetical protein
MGGDDDPHDETASRDAALDGVSNAHLRRLKTTLSSLQNESTAVRSTGHRSGGSVVPIWLQGQQTAPPPPPVNERNLLWPRVAILLIVCGITASLFYYFYVPAAILLAPEHQTEVAAGGSAASPTAPMQPQQPVGVSRAASETAQQGTIGPDPVSNGGSFPSAEPPSKRMDDLQDVTLLMDRGKQFFEAGDLIAARILLLRAVIAGEADAAVALGATYDPVVLADRGDGGIAADLEKERSWYERAKEMGSLEGPRRLEK